MLKAKKIKTSNDQILSTVEWTESDKSSVCESVCEENELQKPGLLEPIFFCFLRHFLHY